MVSKQKLFGKERQRRFRTRALYALSMDSKIYCLARERCRIVHQGEAAIENARHPRREDAAWIKVRDLSAIRTC